GAQTVLDAGRAHVLAARGDQDVLAAIDEPQRPVLRPLPHVAGHQPAVPERRGRLLRLVPVPGEEVGASHEDAALVVEADLDAGRRAPARRGRPASGPARAAPRSTPRPSRSGRTPRRRSRPRPATAWRPTVAAARRWRRRAGPAPGRPSRAASGRRARARAPP